MADEAAQLDPLTGRPYRGCDVCRHFDPRGLPRCAAYPDGIPLPILGGDIAHDRPLPGDHGIQFEPLSVEEIRAREGRLALGDRDRAAAPS
jgi:hypothetical protein